MTVRKEADEKVQVRSDSQQQRRLVTRLCVSVETLLRLRLDLPTSPKLKNSPPVPPAEARRLLQLLADGTPQDALIQYCI